MAKELTLFKDKKKLIDELRTEINNEYKDDIKQIVKLKMKEIRMTEILLMRQKQELDDIISGKKKITEEELLFDDSE